MSVFVIAEAAATHDGRLTQAYRLIELAAAIGADACKFQWLSSPERLVIRRCALDYLEAYRLLAFPREWLPLLKVACETNGVEFMCTAYLPEDIPVIAPFVRRFKVASLEAQDREFIQAHRAFGKPIVVSLGAADAQTESGAAGHLLTERGDAILHCVSAYPTPVEQINLRAISRLKHWGWTPATPLGGLSDHTKHPWTGALAVAAGADLVEFHIRLDDTAPDNADFAVARTPAEAREYVANLRLAEQMLGDGLPRVMPCEAPMLRYRVRP